MRQLHLCYFDYYYLRGIFLVQNSFAMREWHVKHMEIGYDIKHGVTTEQVLLLLQKIRNDSSFSNLQKNDDSMQRLNELDKHFLPSKQQISYAIGDSVTI